jgi:hypothetical protein
MKPNKKHRPGPHPGLFEAHSLADSGLQAIEEAIRLLCAHDKSISEDKAETHEMLVYGIKDLLTDIESVIGRKVAKVYNSTPRYYHA